MGINYCHAAILLVLINGLCSQESEVTLDLKQGALDFLEDLDKTETPRIEDHDHSHHEHHGHQNHGHPKNGEDVTNQHALHDMSEHEGHMMKMWFHGGFDEVILFDFWRTDSLLDMLLSCAAIFIMGATYEGVKWFRVFLQINQSQAVLVANRSCVELALQNRSSSPGHQGVSRNPSVSNSKMSQQHEPFITATPLRSASPFAPQRLIQGFLYIVQLIIAYWLMLIVMTYNTYLTAAVVLGAGFGHWLFAVLQLRNNDAENADSFQTDACH